jgi:hypothetical protein
VHLVVPQIYATHDSRNTLAASVSFKALHLGIELQNASLSSAAPGYSGPREVKDGWWNKLSKSGSKPTKGKAADNSQSMTATISVGSSSKTKTL